MKNLIVTLLTACISFSGLATAAQALPAKKLPLNEPDYTKPKLFADLPDRIDFNPNDLLNLFELQRGQSVSVTIGRGFIFAGDLVSKSSDTHSSSVVVRSTNRPGARLVFTRIIGENNSVKYLGRIISFKHGDCYEIVSENDHYYFKKKSIYDVISE
jgi:hypothetical protein